MLFHPFILLCARPGDTVWCKPSPGCTLTKLTDQWGNRLQQAVKPSVMCLAVHGNYGNMCPDLLFRE